MFPPALLLLLGLVGASQGCLDPASAYRHSGAVCRITYPAAVVLNEKTTQVIEAAFQHAKYPSMKGEKTLLFIGKAQYGLDNLEVHNLSIGRSEFELQPGQGIAMEITNVSAVFKGTIQYGYGSWLLNLGHSVDFEIQSNIDLGIKPKLYCSEGKVAADTSNCYLTFHKLRLLLQGERQPGWLKRLFTDFITFTVKLVIKSQICKEINNVANILAHFIQERAEHFISDGDISMDIAVTSAPVITSTYIESYHKGLARYRGVTAVMNASVFDPAQLTEDRMLYFWISDDVFNPLVTAAHHDGRLHLNISGPELSELFQTNLSIAMPEVLRQCLRGEAPVLRVWSASVPHLSSSPLGTSVRARAAVELSCGAPDDPGLYFETDVEVVVTASYADKKLILNATASEVSIRKTDTLQLEEAGIAYFREAVESIGIPKVISVLETGITTLMDRQGTSLFDIIHPKVISQHGYVIIQMDFGFPHHLLVEFLRKTLE